MKYKNFASVDDFIIAAKIYGEMQNFEAINNLHSGLRAARSVLIGPWYPAVVQIFAKKGQSEQVC